MIALDDRTAHSAMHFNECVEQDQVNLGRTVSLKSSPATIQTSINQVFECFS